MANKPGRLYRKLDWLPKPIFAVQTPNIGTLTDDSIQSIVIHRGKSDNSGGVNPTTVEVKLANNLVAAGGKDISVVIRNVVTTALAAKFTADPDTPAYIRDRFRGRVGTQSMDDQSNGKQYNTVMGASWTAQLAYAPNVHNIATSTNIGTLLTTILKPSYLASKIVVTALGDYDTSYEIAAGTYSDLIGKYASDIGILIRDTRAGETQIVPMPYRRDRALAAIPTSSPLARSQAISPATWTQPNESPSTEYRLTYRDAGNVVRTIVTTGTGTVSGTAPVEDLDWTYFRALTDQWRYVWAMRAETFDNRFRIETIKVDLLHLLSSDNPYHWEQAGYLLKMQVGDPIFLSGDWASALQGAHFAEGITEKIDSDTWEITLSLIRFREITGEEPITPVPARVWDQANYSWDTETRKWDEA